MSELTKKERILEQGVQLLRERSYGELTIDDVAQASGVTRGLVLYYFPSREQLFSAIGRFYIESGREIYSNDTDQDDPDWFRQEVELFLEMAAADLKVLQATTVDMAGLEGMRETIDAMADFTARRVARAAGAAADSDILLGSLRAWGRACVDLALRGVPSASVTSEQLRRLMLAHLDALLRVIAEEEPELGIHVFPLDREARPSR